MSFVRALSTNTTLFVNIAQSANAFFLEQCHNGDTITLLRIIVLHVNSLLGQSIVVHRKTRPFFSSHIIDKDKSRPFALVRTEETQASLAVHTTTQGKRCEYACSLTAFYPTTEQRSSRNISEFRPRYSTACIVNQQDSQTLRITRLTCVEHMVPFQVGITGGPLSTAFRVIRNGPRETSLQEDLYGPPMTRFARSDPINLLTIHGGLSGLPSSRQSRWLSDFRQWTKASPEQLFGLHSTTTAHARGHGRSFASARDWVSALVRGQVRRGCRKASCTATTTRSGVTPRVDKNKRQGMARLAFGRGS